MPRLRSDNNDTMLSNIKAEANNIPVWGGLEATVNRVGDRFQDQYDWSGHADRLQDFDLVASLGVRALRTPVLWERVAPNDPEEGRWEYSDAVLATLQEKGINPIVGLVHHGSGPHYTDLLDPEFPEKLAHYASRVAERYPWVEAYTPVNEPLTTARFSALYGHWYPHTKDDHSFAVALLNEVRATVLAMRAIREVNPRAKLIQTDDLGKIHATPALQYQADLENERRWITWDLLTGMVRPGQPMYDFLRDECGIDEDELAWFMENTCPPDVIGVNHYISSERFLDDRLEHYRPEEIGGNGKHEYADVLAARVRAEGCDGFETVLTEAWDRYGIPLAITECHMGCTREEQVRWLVDTWEAAHRVRERGADVVGFTVWSLFGAYDWNSLLTDWTGSYEPGVFDLRSPEPRPTALANVVRQLAEGKTPEHPVLAGPGWWEREMRFEYPPCPTCPRFGGPVPREIVERPILITGAGGMLAQALVEACELRGLAYRALSRTELDVADPDAVREAIGSLRPWAVVNAAGRVRTADACAFYRDNIGGAAVLASACERSGARLVTFTSDAVFDGQKGVPYDEDDVPCPHNAYGRSQREAEQCVRHAHPDALIVRTSTLFGPWDDRSVLHRALTSLARGESPNPEMNRLVTATYLPDLVHATLDLLVDAEAGTWHLTNSGTVRFSELTGAIAAAAGIEIPRVVAEPVAAATPLVSRRGQILPTWENAVDRHIATVEPRLKALRQFAWR